MFNGRILVVSGQKAVIDTLRPVIQSQGHLALTVSSSEEALGVLEEGIIPDVVLAEGAEDEARPLLLTMFRRLNRLGQYIVLDAESYTATRTSSGAGADPDTIRVPFSEDAVGDALSWAMEQIRRDLQAVRAELFRETARLQEAIRNAQLEMVTALALTMEAKDPYMRGHCARVSTMATRIARRLGVDEETTERLATAALIHEIGKIGISLDLLHHPGSLTEAQMAQVRQYPQIGAQITASIPSLRRLAPLIAHQHDDWTSLADGPDRVLTGILRVADVHDAMTSERPYREVLPRAQWEAILREEAGTSFHAPSVEALLALVDEDAPVAA
jgi:response regulator RpfG family c-di-GMP phosphodiesterase